MSLLDLFSKRLRGEYSTGPHSPSTSVTLSQEMIQKAIGKSGLEKFRPISEAKGIQRVVSPEPIKPEPKEMAQPTPEPIKEIKKVMKVVPQEPIRPEPREVQPSPQEIRRHPPTHHSPPPPQEPIRPVQTNLDNRQSIHELKGNISSIDEKLSQMGSGGPVDTRQMNELKHMRSEVQSRLEAAVRFNR